MKKWMWSYKKRLLILAAFVLAVVSIWHPEYAENVARAFVLLLGVQL